jgi:coenzyme F420-reducing hydrogenase delta subunit
MPCTGMLPPSFIDYALSRGLADGVMIAGCREGSCHKRFGRDWAERRLDAKRDPYLRARVPRARVARVWASSIEHKRLVAEIAAFAERIEALDDPTEERLAGDD